jgi:hypothetical protein
MPRSDAALSVEWEEGAVECRQHLLSHALPVLRARTSISGVYRNSLGCLPSQLPYFISCVSNRVLNRSEASQPAEAVLERIVFGEAHTYMIKCISMYMVGSCESIVIDSSACWVLPMPLLTIKGVGGNEVGWKLFKRWVKRIGRKDEVKPCSNNSRTGTASVD